jgi:hypothetical protein
MGKTDKNIVLDIDATLLDTREDEGGYENLKLFSSPKMAQYRHRAFTLVLDDVTEKKGTGEVIKLYGTYRPFLDEFLDFCVDYFDNIIIWSAGKKDYVEELTRKMFYGRKKQPLVIYSHSDCNIYGDDITKELSKLYKDKRTKGMLNETNTFVIDDRDDTFSKNPENGIKIPIYEANLALKDLKKKDPALERLILWFLSPEVVKSKDVRKLDKSKIFVTTRKYYESLYGN